MGKHIKTKMDYDMIEQLAREVHKLDPDNAVLKKFAEMDNYEGAELRKSLAKWANKQTIVQQKV